MWVAWDSHAIHAPVMGNLLFRFLTGPRQGQKLSFPGPRVRIGRSRDNDLVLPENESPASSAHHAEAVLENRKWWLIDLDSTNGTYTNGKRIPASERVKLHNGDRIGLGGPPVLVTTVSNRKWLLLCVLILFITGLMSVGYRELREIRLGFEPTAAAAVQSVYLIVVEEDGKRQAVGSAFAVRREGILATNAHVAEELRRRATLVGEGLEKALAVRSDSSGKAIRILEIHLHPEYERGSFRNDIALLRLADGPPLIPLQLADESSLARLRRGVRLAAFGFPAPSIDPRRPRGRLSEDVLGDIRGGRYLEIGLGIVPGMSGSPIFISDGSVVGVVVGGDFLSGESEKGTKVVSSGVNWGVSTAVLRELLDEY